MKKSAFRTLIREIVETVIVSEARSHRYKTEWDTKITRQVDLDKYPNAEEDTIVIPITCQCDVYKGTNDFDDPTEVGFDSVVNSQTGEPVELDQEEMDAIAAEILGDSDQGQNPDHDYERDNDR